MSGLAPGTRAAAFAAAMLLAPVALSSNAVAAPKTHTVVIDKMAFGPAPAGVRAGDVVVWVNKDMFRHTATAKDKSFDVDLAPGKSVRMVVRKVGPVSYFCRFHPGMTGRISVAK